MVTGRTRHESQLRADLAQGAGLRCREVLVLGCDGERPGRLSSSVHLVRAGRPVLRQRLEIGDPALDGSAAYLAGRRVLATEIMIDAGPLWMVVHSAGRRRRYRNGVACFGE